VDRGDYEHSKVDCLAVADLESDAGGGEAPRSSAEGATGVGCEEGYPPPHRGRDLVLS